MGFGQELRCQVISMVSLFDGGRHRLVVTSRRLGARAVRRPLVVAAQCAAPPALTVDGAMGSLRARPTILVLRVVLRPSAVRSRNHWASRLSFWKIRKRQASWIMPRRTRPLPARANPFSRQRLPLWSGAPVSPA